MEIPRARIIRVASASPPECLDTTVDKPLARTSPPEEPQGTPITFEEQSRWNSAHSRELELDRVGLGYVRPQSGESSFSSVINSVFQSPVSEQRAPLLHDSASTAPDPVAGEEEESRKRWGGEEAEQEISQVLEWFRSTFQKIGKHEGVTLRDFKLAARECEVRTVK